MRTLIDTAWQYILKSSITLDGEEIPPINKQDLKPEDYDNKKEKITVFLDVPRANRPGLKKGSAEKLTKDAFGIISNASFRYSGLGDWEGIEEEMNKTQATIDASRFFKKVDLFCSQIEKLQYVLNQKCMYLKIEDDNGNCKRGAVSFLKQDITDVFTGESMDNVIITKKPKNGPDICMKFGEAVDSITGKDSKSGLQLIKTEQDFIKALDIFSIFAPRPRSIPQDCRDSLDKWIELGMNNRLVIDSPGVGNTTLLLGWINLAKLGNQHLYYGTIQQLSSGLSQSKPNSVLILDHIGRQNNTKNIEIQKIISRLNKWLGPIIMLIDENETNLFSELEKSPNWNKDKHVLDSRTYADFLIKELSNEYLVSTNPSVNAKLEDDINKQHPPMNNIIDLFYRNKESELDITNVSFENSQNKIISQIESVTTQKKISLLSAARLIVHSEPELPTFARTALILELEKRLCELNDLKSIITDILEPILDGLFRGFEVPRELKELLNFYSIHLDEIELSSDEVMIDVKSVASNESESKVIQIFLSEFEWKYLLVR
jgi:hypothetical protein